VLIYNFQEKELSHKGSDLVHIECASVHECASVWMKREVVGAELQHTEVQVSLIPS